MRIWALAPVLGALSWAGAAHAANVVDDRTRVWPTGTIDVVVCDENGVERFGADICRPQPGWLPTWLLPPRRGPELAQREVETVRDAVARWNVQFSDNIRLREVGEVPDGPFIVFRAASRTTRCSTRRVGYSPRRTRNYISVGSHCNPVQDPDGTTSGAVLHEIMHAIGFYHEQQRADRGHMLRVEPDELGRSAAQWKRLCPAEQDCEGPPAAAVGSYDFGSIMHYSLEAAPAELTMAGWKTLKRQQLEPTEIGQRERFSPTDVAAVELLYPSRYQIARHGPIGRPDAPRLQP